MERIDTVEVLFNANRYILQLSEDVYCDYLACLDWLKDKRVRTQPDFEYFYDIISKGEVFKGESFDWMDDFKSYICNSTVDVLSRFIDTYSIEEEADRVIQIADQILLNDPCNEEALLYKIKTLISQNNFKSAAMRTTLSRLVPRDVWRGFPLFFRAIRTVSADGSAISPLSIMSCLSIGRTVPLLWHASASMVANACAPLIATLSDREQVLCL